MLEAVLEHFVAVGQGTMKKIKDFKIRKTARKWFGGTTGVYYYAVLIDFRVACSIFEYPGAPPDDPKTGPLAWLWAKPTPPKTPRNTHI